MIKDSSCVLPLVFIDSQECVGDSVGKYNYNALALDTTLCNLSSYFFTGEDNAKNTFDSLSTLMIEYQPLLEIFTADLKNEFLKASTTVNLLSAFWGKYEFSIQIPINAVTLAANDLNLFAYTLSTINLQAVDRLVNGNLKGITELHLNVNYPANNYPEFTVINASFFVYNIVPAIRTPGSTDPLVKTRYTPVSRFNFNNRTINAQYTRDNVHLNAGPILRFYKENDRWNFMGYYLNNDIATAEPNYNRQVINQIPLQEKVSASKSTNILGACDPIEANKWYSTALYIYANSLYTGSSSKLGTITLTLRTPDNKTESYSHTARGYNPNTGTGGTDVFLEFDGKLINAYEQFPNTKILVRSWINPFSQSVGVNFKYTFDRKGISFTACASTSIV
jgi:hypothetical protein